jgi:hypothetical protein
LTEDVVTKAVVPGADPPLAFSWRNIRKLSDVIFPFSVVRVLLKNGNQFLIKINKPTISSDKSSEFPFKMGSRPSSEG